jgi:hypothetical protein
VDADAKNSNRGGNPDPGDDHRRGFITRIPRNRPRASHLRELGLSARRIARALGVSDKTVAKSIDRLCVDLSPVTPDAAGAPLDD